MTNETQPNQKELIKLAGLDYTWYVAQAESIVRELKQDHCNEAYILEKINNVLRLFIDIREERARQELIKKQGSMKE